MGILTNPQTREKLVKVVSKYNNFLCVVCYIVGVIWFMALAYRPMNAGVYFSENALLPGLVTTDFKHDHGTGDFYNKLKDEIRRIKEEVDSAPSRSKDETALYKLPAPWFDQQFRELGLEAYVQNYSFTYPAAILKDQRYYGRNVYGILRAPRAASTEALVLAAPYRPPGADADRTGTGIALMLALAKAFRKHTYWAKDIIFLVTEHEEIGMQAWLSAYHYDVLSDYILAGELHGRSGSIQAAINLELGSESISRLNIKAEGLNGQLPNLDLINTVAKLCRREMISPAVQKKVNHNHPESRDGFEQSLRTMATMMWHQASNVATGNHGLFHRYHIEAVTLQGVRMKGAKREHDMLAVGRVVEGIFRSLNNLLERFHQSFFFYLLPATDRYVSIGLYMPPFGVLALPIIIKALALWIAHTTDAEKSEEATEEAKEDEGEKEEDAEKSEEKDGEKTEETAVEKEKREYSTAGLIPPLLMAVIFGIGAYRSPYFFVETARLFRMQPQEGLVLGVIAVHLAGLMFPRMLHRRGSSSVLVSWRLHKCVGLLATGVVLAGLGVINISLAVLLTAVWTPVLLVIKPSHSGLLNLLQYLLLLAISPLGLLFWACLLQTTLIERPSDPSVDLLAGVWGAMESGALTAVVDGALLGNWLFPLAACVVFPLWLVFWALMWADVDK